MSHFNRGNDRGGRFGGNKGGFKRGGGRSDRGGGRSEMHQAICSKCGKSCEVPFRPTGEKPVYCKECFGAQGGGGGRSDRFPRKDFHGGFREKPNFEGNRGSGGNVGHDEVKRQLELVNKKLDRLIQIMEISIRAKQPQAKEMIKNGNADAVKVKAVAKKPAKKAKGKK